MNEQLSLQTSAAVERALAEIRAGRPVVLVDQGEHLLVAGVEALDAEMAATLPESVAVRLILPAPRLRRLGLTERDAAGAVALPVLDVKRVERLALQLEAKIDAPVSAITPLEAAGLELARLALILPTIVTMEVSHDAVRNADWLQVEADAVRHYRRESAAHLAIVSRAPVPLDGATETEFVIFRGGEGMRDQVAIIVGKPNFAQPVTVRLHSACLTGDLFGSLKCDCGDQLRGTVQYMAEHEGGVLLYLDQEGRGNGIANKIRAYKLQAQGFDTYDADEVLGFDHDQRGFDFAARMLQLLGITRVKVMTNNPIKIAALASAGLDVVSAERILGRQTDQNIHYLATKRDKAGHFIDLDELVVRAKATE
ncbi:GTP cyclohydrolase II RibA [Methylovirgula sp. 4M-Z18]|uniref:GTP cyclohydrolase II RibA n=1 Tax=Methylovirgula sp. 4M-Z18 TaxID=2293567 RepID=UPI000E2FB02B|nr:GTP cyclohydrolase II RibA [Methylovirgula sp. 4M-Z18]RFB79505.1 GTP cyclohydrolase II RibA [Methylovirgula sp. 4M-Z18]